MRASATTFATAILMTSAASAAELEFTVEAPRNLMLTISGYAADEAQLFSSTTNQFRDVDGKTVYSLLVDEADFSAPLTKWCVVDLTGKWDAVPEGAASLCDETLERHGNVYLFAGVAPQQPQPEFDDSPLPPKLAAACVQGQLNTAGFSVGTVDGDIGRRSISAAKQYAEANGLDGSLPELSGDTAEEWCRTLAGRDPQLAAFLSDAIDEMNRQNSQYGAAADFRFAISSGVPDDQIDLIKVGIDRAEAYLEANLGGGIPSEIRRGVTVKIVATGRGNEEPGGGNGAATAFSDEELRPFFDVRNAQWNQNTQGRGWTVRSDSMKTVAHEYAHIWQGHLGAISGVYQPLPGWINEGLAEYLGYRVMVEAGDMDWNDVRPFVLNGALAEQLRVPLSQLSIWSGHVGFIAIDWLVDETPNGLMSLRILGEAVGNGASAADAFEQAFGVDMRDFYDQFGKWRAEILKNPRRAFSNRPDLVLSGEAG